LGRLAQQTAPSNPLLSASLYQVLGLSILLSRKLYRARKLRKLDITRDTKSLQLYHHIIWLAREGLSITEVYILPYCQDGEQGPECRVMAAKLRASLYHVFCLFHNHPPVNQLSARSTASDSPSSTTTAKKVSTGKKSPPSRKSPKDEAESNDVRRRTNQPAFRDPIPSVTSDASYITNPYAMGTTATPPPPGLATLKAPHDARRTPSRPPGLVPINVPASQAAVSFLLPPLNFVPMAREHFETVQNLANSLLAPTHGLRLSVSLEHSAFLWDCAREHDRSRKLARRTIRQVYSSSDGLDDDEFADAAVLVQSLAAIVRRGSNESTPRPSNAQLQHLQQSPSPSSPRQSRTSEPPQQRPMTIDRTIAVSPAERRNQATSPLSQQPQYRTTQAQQAQYVPRTIMRTPERLSTVPEVESVDEAATVTLSPPISRLSNRTSSQRRASSVTSQASDKASKRRLVEQAEERAMSRQNSSVSRGTSHRGSPSRATRIPGAFVDGIASRRESPNVASRTGGSQRGSPDNTGRARSASNVSQHSRQATPTDGYVRKPKSPSPKQHQQRHGSGHSRDPSRGGNG